MKAQYRNHNIYLITYVLIVVLWLVSMLIKAERTEGRQIRFDDEQYFDCNEGWYDDDGKVFNIEELVFTREDVLKEKTVHFRIPEDWKLNNGDALCFFSRGMDFKVYATAHEDSPNYGSEDFGSRDIYEYQQNAANLSGNDIGLTVQVVPINVQDKYNELSISITPAEYSAFILDMRIEKASDYVYNAIRSRMPRFIWSLFILFFGLAMIIYTLFAVERKREFIFHYIRQSAYDRISGDTDTNRQT